MLDSIDPLLWVPDLDKSSNINRFSRWVVNDLLQCRSLGLKIPEEPIEKILTSADGLRFYCGRLYEDAGKDEQGNYAQRWSYKNWTADFDVNFNPVYIDRLRKHLSSKISDVVWLQKHFSALKDAPKHLSGHRYAFGSSPNESVISIDIARYLIILRYSLFVRSKLLHYGQLVSPNQ